MNRARAKGKDRASARSRSRFGGPFQAVLLDCMGTLVELRPPAPRLRAELRRRAGLEVSETDARAAFRAEIRYYLANHLDGRDEASLDALRDRCADVLRDSLGLDEGTRPALRAAMLAALEFRAYADAAPALAQLRARGLRLVAASNWDCSLPRVLEEAGLRDLLDGVVSSAAVGAAKPDPRLFHAALAAARCPPERALAVGDSPDHDIGGARAAGVAAVLVRRSPDAPAMPGVTAIEALDELPAVI